MKRFTMLAKAIAVIAIAGASLAFTEPKTNRYCIDDGDPDLLCNNFFQGAEDNENGTEYSFLQGFTPASPGDCAGRACTTPTVKIKLTVDEP